MDGRGFDAITRTLADGRSRRSILKGLLGAVGGLTALAAGRSASEAAWSTLVCLPVGSEVTARLVPTASVPFYVQRYGAVVAENGSCPVCLTTAQCPLFTTCSGGACVDPCTLLDCSCSPLYSDACLKYVDGTAACLGDDWGVTCTETMANCTSDDVCVGEYGAGYRCAIVEGGTSADCLGYPNTCQFTTPIDCSA